MILDTGSANLGTYVRIWAARPNHRACPTHRYAALFSAIAGSAQARVYSTGHFYNELASQTAFPSPQPPFSINYVGGGLTCSRVFDVVTFPSADTNATSLSESSQKHRRQPPVTPSQWLSFCSSRSALHVHHLRHYRGIRKHHNIFQVFRN